MMTVVCKPTLGPLSPSARGSNSCILSVQSHHVGENGRLWLLKLFCEIDLDPVGKMLSNKKKKGKKRKNVLLLFLPASCLWLRHCLVKGPWHMCYF